VPGSERGRAGDAETEERLRSGTVSRETFLWWLYRRRGDIEARNEIVMLHSSWAQRAAKGFAAARRLDWREVWGHVALGLIEAVRRFDPGRGVPFRAFASRRIAGSLRDAGREALGSRTSPEGEPPHSRTVRLDGGRGAGDPHRAGWGLRARGPDPLDQACIRETRSRLIEAVPDGRAREIAERRFWLGESVDEIGLALGLGKSAVQEILASEVLPRARRALRRMGIEPPRSGRRRRARGARPGRGAARRGASGPRTAGRGTADE
jgi:RNA polymerase sigma factor (sigma-70 family)